MNIAFDNNRILLLILDPEENKTWMKLNIDLKTTGKQN